ncbi:hypothetical protein TraAM80_04763 [Trypanosoma rangeli]|uniref:FHA domain-containing protein n=1 Tax=Trypanosoma rangeli TaxID=5698 RepID=A0A422NI89_TRYRA|nr:uncharacterized protein TraAM80_04763 [Trypanosoma rangeli]RNF05190.1 hypothetical protein TraAM80_04763 [Trypanosoma rangeli]|eukprot:RNF05190.1 hypothetical protein TraAM80_04763 [Trypanosoma rangeli]
MHGSATAPLWRLKVINGCQRNDDLLLPVAPQPSLLQPFYAHWHDEDEERQNTTDPAAEDESASVNRPDDMKTRKSKRKKMKLSAARRRMIAPRDWLKRIPHLVLGRHTCLPRPCRLRHACVSRLHCRVVYVSDATMHRQLLSKYPPAGRGSATNNPKRVSEDVKDYVVIDDDAKQEDGEGALFTGPYYRLINFGSNPLYVNDGPLPAGESKALCEHDFVAFLENPFDAEGGVLQPLRPEDAAATNNEEKTEPIDAITEKGPTTGSPTARVLFESASTTTAVGESSAQACNLEACAGACVPPLFVEVNGVRVARYLPRCVPPDVLQRLGTAAVTISGGATLGRSPQLAVDHNRLLGSLRREPSSRPLPNDETKGSFVKESKSPAQQSDCGVAMATLADKSDEYFTPPPKCPAGGMEPEEGKEHNIVDGEAEAEAEEDEGLDIAGDVVSPLRQRLVPSPWRCSSSCASMTPEAKGCLVAASSDVPCRDEKPAAAAPFIVVPPRLPVYIFARRSPSPEEFTRQAPFIGRFKPRQPKGNGEPEASDEAKKHHADADATSQTGLVMTEWVQEMSAEATVPSPQSRRGRVKPVRRRRRVDR